MKAMKVYIDKESLMKHIPEQYKDCEIVFAQVENHIHYVEFTAVLANEPIDEDQPKDDFTNVRREYLILDDN